MNMFKYVDSLYITEYLVLSNVLLWLFFKSKLLLITYLLLLIVTVVGEIVAVVLQIWKWNKAGHVNDRFDRAHFCKFGQYLYFCILVSSASFLLLRFVSYTLWPLCFKIIFGNCNKTSLLMKHYSISSDHWVFTLLIKEQNWLQKYFLNSRIVGRRKMPNFSLNIICNVLWIWIYKTSSHFNDLVFKKLYYSWLGSFRKIWVTRSILRKSGDMRLLHQHWFKRTDSDFKTSMVEYRAVS